MVLYKEFRVGDLFRLKSIRQIPRGFVPELKEDGEHPYLTQKTGGSYGVNGYMDETDELELIEEPMIVTGVDNVANGVMYWWDKPFYANKMLGLLNENLNRERAQYIITVLLKMYMGFDYNNKINMKIVRETVIELPVKSLEDNEPDWDYMEEYIKQKELAYIGKLNQEFDRKKEQLIELIGEESEYINIEELPTAKFKVGDLFKVGRGNVGNQKKLVESNEGVNFIAQNDNNNGYVMKVGEGKYKVFGGNKIIVGRQTGAVYYQHEPFVTTDGVLVMTNDEFIRSKEVGLYIVTLLEKQMVNFGYTNTVSAKKLKDLDIELPINPEVSDLVPDWETMEDYVNGIKHLYKHREEEEHKAKLELLYELTGWTEDDLGNIGGGGSIIKVLIDWNEMEKYVARIELQLLNRITNTLNK